MYTSVFMCMCVRVSVNTFLCMFICPNLLTLSFEWREKWNMWKFTYVKRQQTLITHRKKTVMNTLVLRVFDSFLIHLYVKFKSVIEQIIQTEFNWNTILFTRKKIDSLVVWIHMEPLSIIPCYREPFKYYSITNILKISEYKFWTKRYDYDCTLKRRSSVDLIDTFPHFQGP